MSTSARVLEATQANFAQLVVENSFKGPVLVDFWAPWAGPSRRQRELLVRLAEDYGGRFLLVTVDTDREKGLAGAHGVTSLPSCILFRKGKPVAHLRGMQTETDYRALIERHLLPLSDQVQAAALIAWRNGDRERAIQVLVEGAMAEPDHPGIPLLLAKLLIQDGRFRDAREVLAALPEPLARDEEAQGLRIHAELILAGQEAAAEETLMQRLEADPADADARLALAATRLLADDYDAALNELALLHGQRPDYRDGLPRRAITVLLATLKLDDERLRHYRNRLFAH